MGRTLLFVSLAVGAAAISTSAVGIRKSPSRQQVRHDSRRLGPGTHRAGPAELAVRNRVAREEQLKIEARKHAVSVPSTTWVSLGPTDATREFNGVDIDSVDSGRPN